MFLTIRLTYSFKLTLRHSFLPYDYTRQPRKSWFVGTSSEMSSTEAVIALNLPRNSNKLKLSDQPLSEMISRTELNTTNSLQISGEDVAGNGNGKERESTS